MKWKSSKTLGNELETTVKNWLDQSGIPYEQESTMTQNGKRSKGSVDFKLTNPIGFIECKRYTDRLTFKCMSEIHDIKWSQVEFLYKNRDCEVCGFMVKEALEDCCYFIPIQSFISYFMHTDSKSINSKDVKNIGMKVNGLDWVKLCK